MLEKDSKNISPIFWKSRTLKFANRKSRKRIKIEKKPQAHEVHRVKHAAIQTATLKDRGPTK